MPGGGESSDDDISSSTPISEMMDTMSDEEFKAMQKGKEDAMKHKAEQKVQNGTRRTPSRPRQSRC